MAYKVIHEGSLVEQLKVLYCTDRPAAELRVRCLCEIYGEKRVRKFLKGVLRCYEGCHSEIIDGCTRFNEYGELVDENGILLDPHEMDVMCSMPCATHVSHSLAKLRDPVGLALLVRRVCSDIYIRNKLDDKCLAEIIDMDKSQSVIVESLVINLGKADVCGESIAESYLCKFDKATVIDTVIRMMPFVNKEIFNYVIDWLVRMDNIKWAALKECGNGDFKRIAEIAGEKAVKLLLNAFWVEKDSQLIAELLASFGEPKWLSIVDEDEERFVRKLARCGDKRIFESAVCTAASCYANVSSKRRSIKMMGYSGDCRALQHLLDLLENVSFEYGSQECRRSGHARAILISEIIKALSCLVNEVVCCEIRTFLSDNSLMICHETVSALNALGKGVKETHFSNAIAKQENARVQLRMEMKRVETAREMRCLEEISAAERRMCEQEIQATIRDECCGGDCEVTHACDDDQYIPDWNSGMANTARTSGSVKKESNVYEKMANSIDVSKYALKELANYKCGDVVHLLLQSLFDEEPLVRVAARDSLGMLGETLWRFVVLGDADDFVRLGKCGDCRTRSICLERMVQHKMDDMGFRLLIGIASTCDLQALKSLIFALGNDKCQFTAEIVSAMKECKSDIVCQILIDTFTTFDDAKRVNLLLAVKDYFVDQPDDGGKHFVEILRAEEMSPQCREILAEIQTLMDVASWPF